MKVRLLGFTSEITDTADKSPISMDSFMEHLIDDQDTATSIGAHGRLLYVDKHTDSDYFLGIVITVKDQKRYCELLQNGKKFTIKVTDLENKMMDFNFFVLNKKSGIGLYQHYHQSCGINSFFHILSSKFNQFKNNLIESEVNKEENIGTNANMRKIKKKFRGSIGNSILVKKDKLEKLIAELEKIKSFEFEYTYLDIKEPEFQPIRDVVKKERKKYIFEKGGATSIISSAVGKFVKNNQLDEGKITGIDVDGNERIYRIMNNPDNFGELDYDDIAEKLNELDISNFQTSWVIKELLKACNKNSHIFKAKLN